VNRVHGFGAVGVAIDSAPTEGVKVTPLSEIKSGFPILKNPANQHRAVGFTPKQWHYVFEDESLALYERYHIPASGRVFWGSALANIHPGKDDTYVDYHNDARAPLLFISGKQDHLFPPKVGHSNVKHYKSNTVTEIVEFDGPHLLPAIPGVARRRGLCARLGVAAREVDGATDRLVVGHSRSS
jgi:pimeloyl-ACP methyl ester carboxylesterase